VRKIAVAASVVEHDATHRDSPLCACSQCNDTWLQRQQQPLSKKHDKPVLAVDTAKLPMFKARFRAHGLTLVLHEHSNTRMSFWHIHNADNSWSLTTGFDIDLERALTQLADGRPLQQVDISFHAAPVARTTGSPATLTGGPFCAMCGEPATLPCPNMVGRAKLLGIRLFFPADDARLGAARLHPGRCRKRLNDLIHAALVKQDATNK
jgi:hypothetical protein